MDQGTNQQQTPAGVVQLTEEKQQTVSAPVLPLTNQPQIQGDQQQAIPQLPVSGPAKEHAPISQPLGETFIAPTDQEPVITPEMKETGMTSVPNQEQIQLKPEVIASGVTPVKTAAPIQIAPSNNITLPMTEKEAQIAMKTHKPDESFRWLATLTEFLIEQAQKMHHLFK